MLKDEAEVAIELALVERDPALVLIELDEVPSDVT